MKGLVSGNDLRERFGFNSIELGFIEVMKSRSILELSPSFKAKDLVDGLEIRWDLELRRPKLTLRIFGRFFIFLRGVKGLSLQTVRFINELLDSVDRLDYAHNHCPQLFSYIPIQKVLSRGFRCVTKKSVVVEV